MNKPRMKQCRAEGCENKFTPSFSTLQKYCSSQCAYDERINNTSIKTYTIPKFSKKGVIIYRAYTPKRKQFLLRPENQFCCIKGKNCQGLANTVEHSKGRGDYFVDKWAQDNNIVKTLDERFWKPACINCNNELENNNELSKEHQYSKIHEGKKI